MRKNSREQQDMEALQAIVDRWGYDGLLVILANFYMDAAHQAQAVKGGALVAREMRGIAITMQKASERMD